MVSSQKVALDALKVALRGEALAYVELSDDTTNTMVEVGASSGRRFKIDTWGTVEEQER